MIAQLVPDGMVVNFRKEVPIIVRPSRNFYVPDLHDLLLVAQDTDADLADILQEEQGASCLFGDLVQ